MASSGIPVESTEHSVLPAVVQSLAAVLVAVVERDSDWQDILQRRTAGWENFAAAADSWVQVR